VPKYSYRVIKDRVGFEVSNTIRVFSERLGCYVMELNVQEDHVHFLVMVPPKLYISIGCDKKGKSAIQVFMQFPYLKMKS
jgi:putative transposase